LKEKFKVSPTCGWTHDAPVQVGVSAGGGGAHTAHGGRLGVAGAADDIQASGGLDPPEVVLQRHAVQAGIVEGHLIDLDDAEVVDLLDGDARRGSDNQAVLVPGGPRRGMSGDGALEAHAVALLDHAVVGNGKELGRRDGIAGVTSPALRNSGQIDAAGAVG